MSIGNAFNRIGGTTDILQPKTVQFAVVEQTSITINHKFSFLPNVFIVDENNNLVGADIKFVSSSQILINFAISFTGFVYLR